MTPVIETPTTEHIEEIIQRLHEGVDESYRAKPRIPSRTIRASSLGVACDLYQVRQFVDYDKAELPSSQLLRIYAQGTQVEHQWTAKARETWRIYDEQQPVEWPKYNISGTLEGRIEIPLNGEMYKVAFEIKSLHPVLWAKFDENPDAWRRMFEMPYYARWPGQGQIYMLAGNEPLILFILVNKSNLQEKFLPMPLDLEYGEVLLKRAERINRYLKEEKRPGPILYDENICGKVCPWRHICQPDIPAKGSAFLEDPDLIEAARICIETKEAHGEYDRNWKFLREQCKGVEHGIIGTDYEITGKEIQIKEQPPRPAKPASTQWRSQLRKLGG